MTRDEKRAFHVLDCEEAGCTHPPVYVRNGTDEHVLGYCALCRAVEEERGRLFAR